MGGAIADGYARASGRIPVVCAQNGPAATLLVPPLAEALKASIPIVTLVQEVERPQIDRNAFQELDHIALFSGCAKWTRRMITADRADDYIDQAFVTDGSGRPGPAVLLLPADLLGEPVVPPKVARKASLGVWPIDRIRPDDQTLAEAARLIAQAEHPVMMVGGGAFSRGGPAAISRLGEVGHLPIFTTNMSKGAVDERHPLSCGVLGALNGPRSLGSHTRPLLAEADLILLVGTRHDAVSEERRYCCRVPRCAAGQCPACGTRRRRLRHPIADARHAGTSEDTLSASLIWIDEPAELPGAADRRPEGIIFRDA
jgi:acetolactate synthase I/II/III large subunit